METNANRKARQLVARELRRVFCEAHRRYGLTPAEYAQLVRQTLERALADAYREGDREAT